MTNLQVWLSDSLTRVFPQTSPAASHRLGFDVARGEKLSFQVCVRHQGEDGARVTVAVEPPSGIRSRIRLVGYVPVPHFNTATPRHERDGVGHLPGLCPDPLFEESGRLVGPDETASFWISLVVERTCHAGTCMIPVIVRREGSRERRMTVVVRIHDLVLKPRRNFPVTHWFYADAILDQYKLQPWEDRFWDLVPAYFRNLTDHGQEVIYTPLFTPALDGVKRPSQLLAVTRKRRNEYAFDWRHVRRWVSLARQAGLRHFEWSHLFTQWGVKHALRIYEGPNGDGSLLWAPETGATSPTYSRFLAQFLPAFKRFLTAEGLLGKSFFHVSDEPHGDEATENYRQGRARLKQLAPWMNVMDALSDIRFGREKLTDMPVASISTALDFRAAGLPCWCYFCCAPRGRFLNRLMDTPLAKIRMSGWLFHTFQMKGFLHWGYNYWQRRAATDLIDPFTESSAAAWPGWAYGDPFVVYPGAHGPLDSIRWEVWAESLQDMALLQTAGVSPDDRMLGAIKSFESFPKESHWIHAARGKLLRRHGEDSGRYSARKGR